VGAIVHTHSKFATAFAQANREIPCLGTTHADHFCGSIPVVYQPNVKDIEERYEEAIGESIVQFFLEKDVDPSHVSAALCPSHGVFCWGKDLEEAVKNAHALELLAEMAYYTHILNQRFDSDRNNRLRNDIMNKHFFRKHGDEKYYGQR
jgi:L-ribulose-5-phosphate 4-epimerase